MPLTYLPTDLQITGTLVVGNFVPPSGSVTDTSIQAAAGIDATKLEHQYAKEYAEDTSTAHAATRRVLHTAYGDGSLVSFAVASATIATSDRTVTVDLLKNGTTVLSATIVLDSGNSTYTFETGTISDAAYVAGDRFEISTALGGTTGNYPNGFYARAIFREDANP